LGKAGNPQLFPCKTLPPNDSKKRAARSLSHFNATKSHPLDLVEADLIAAPVVEACRA